MLAIVDSQEHVIFSQNMDDGIVVLELRLWSALNQKMEPSKLSFSISKHSKSTNCDSSSANSVGLKSQNCLVFFKIFSICFFLVGKVQTVKEETEEFIFSLPEKNYRRPLKRPKT